MLPVAIASLDCRPGPGGFTEAARYKSERWHDVECPGLRQPGSGDAIDAAAGQTIWIEGRLSPSPYLAFPVRIAGAPCCRRERAVA